MTRLIVDPLTRIEGHGRVELLLEAGRLADVKVRLLESPRLFEAIVVGHRYDEVPDLVCRICSICSSVHKLASLQALERAMSLVVPPAASMLRELLLLGGHIQSHALHLFCLVLPDLHGTADILRLLQRKDPLAKAGLELKAYGNRIQEVCGGRVVHPVNPIFGGVAFRPDKKKIEALLAETIDWQGAWPDFAESFLQRSNYPEARPAIGEAIAAGNPELFLLGGGNLWHGEDEVEASAYAELLGEQARADSHAKDAAGAAGPFLAGALARARLAARKGLRAELPTDELGIHGNNVAQIREIGRALERAAQLLKSMFEADGKEPLKTILTEPCGGTGTAVVEAPRGLLIHHYIVDEWGTVVAADVVTPTSINQRVMAAQIKADLAGEGDPDRLRIGAERIVRAYDPCISCAVHLLPSAGVSRQDKGQEWV